MELEKIQDLIKFVAESGANEVKLEMEDFKITIRKGAGKSKEVVVTQQQAPSAVAQPQMQSPALQQQSAPASQEEEQAEEESNLVTMKSPIKIGRASSREKKKINER